MSAVRARATQLLHGHAVRHVLDAIPRIMRERGINVPPWMGMTVPPTATVPARTVVAPSRRDRWQLLETPGWVGAGVLGKWPEGRSGAPHRCRRRQRRLLPVTGHGCRTEARPRPHTDEGRWSNTSAHLLGPCPAGHKKKRRRLPPPDLRLTSPLLLPVPCEETVSRW